jgi:hypothetical protein
LAGLIGAGFASGLIARPVVLLAASAALRLPGGAMRLDRELVRSLGDGQAITVRRSWEIGFAPQARGIVISGVQVAVAVDAPDNLAALARIEEQRDTAAMFPIMLSDSGRILGGGDGETPPDDLAAAMRAAERMIAVKPQPEARREAIRRYLAELHRAGSGLFETLPADLFYPSGDAMEKVESVALPDGLTGEFALSWRARAVPDAGWLAEGERAIVTRIEGLERRSKEVWRLRPA